jgi:Flp pilus assembly secretin CpaC
MEKISEFFARSLLIALLALTFSLNPQSLAASETCTTENQRLWLDLSEKSSEDPMRITLCIGQVAMLKTEEPIGAVIVGKPDAIASNITASDRVLLTALERSESSIVLLSRDRQRDATLNITVTQDAGPNDTVEEAAVLPPDIIVYSGSVYTELVCENTCRPKQ